MGSIDQLKYNQLWVSLSQIFFEWFLNVSKVMAQVANKRISHYIAFKYFKG